MQEFEKLEQLLAQNQFEWLPDGRVVYLMNDAVESFLVFEDAKMTGSFDMEYDGALSARLEQVSAEVDGNKNGGETAENESDRMDAWSKTDGYRLIVRQGHGNAFTIRFSDLFLDVHLYNYGEIGHFWVDGQEDIRQLEYRLAIIRDKLQYLGDEYVNEAEGKLVQLAEFPPIMTRYAVPLKYIDVPKEPWNVTPEAIQTMKSLALEAGDTSLVRLLSCYRKFPGKLMGRYIAWVLTRRKHEKVLALIAEKIKEAAREYPNRSFGAEQDQKYQVLWKQALVRAQEMREQGQQVTVLREEPFVEAPDDLGYKVYLMWSSGRGRKRVVEVEEMKKETGNKN